MRFANWADDVVGSMVLWFEETSVYAWSYREGPREVARRMDAIRVADSPNGVPTWMWRDARHPEGWAFRGYEVPMCVIDAVCDDVQQVADWHGAVVANSRVNLSAAEFAALPDSARAAAMAARRVSRRLPHLTFAQAKATSDEWHREEAGRRNDQVFRD